MSSPSYLQNTPFNSTPSKAFGSTLTPNSYILFTLGNTGNTVSAAHSSAGNTYTLLASSGTEYLYGGLNTAGAVSETVSWTASGSGNETGILTEWSGVNPTTPISGTPSYGVYNSSPVTMNSVTTLVPNCTLVLIATYANTNAAWAYTGSYTGYTKIVNSGQAQLGDGSEATAGTYAPTWTMSGVNNDLFLVALAQPVAATPTFSPMAGTYTGTQTVTITSSTVGVTIYYTTNGSTPTEASPSIANGGTVSVASSLTLKAIAGNLSGYTDSAVGSAAYTITSGGGNASWLSVAANNALRGSRSH